MAIPTHEGPKSDVPKDNGGVTPPEETTIQLVNQSKMRRLQKEEVDKLGLPERPGALITTGVRRINGKEELVYILKTSEGSVFQLDKDHQLIQELQVKAASAAIDTFEALTPLETANAIRQEIAKFGFSFDGGPLEAWDFAIQSMDKMIAFQEKQLKLHQINALQSATLQLEEDANLNIIGWTALPPHRRQAAMILTQLGLAAAVQQFTSDQTVGSAENLKRINKLFEEMAQEKKDIQSQASRDRAYDNATKVKEYLGDILSQGNQNAVEMSKSLMSFVFGEDLKDEGVIKATLIRSGESGQKLWEMIERSGLGVNGFLRNVFKDAFPKKPSGEVNNKNNHQPRG